MNNKFYNVWLPYLLVTFQLSALGYIAVSGHLFSGTWYGLLVESAGVALAVWAILVMWSNANVAPIPKQNGMLITSGPYQFIRHPMYTAQVLAVIPLVVEYPTDFRIAALFTLIVTLLFKLHYEEKRLVKHFGQPYSDYQTRSKKILPFIY
jgi:protein-S-isoprenylcysteine O-methyltransferase Ste14